MRTYFPKCKVLICSLSVIILLFSCKKNTLDNPDILQQSNIAATKTVKQVVFSDQADIPNSISQVSSDKMEKRVLIPLKSRKLDMHKYILVKQNVQPYSQSRTFVISKQPITGENDLFAIPFEKDEIVAYDINSKKGVSSKLLLKHNNKELNYNDKIDTGGQNIVPTYEGYCIDHWWVTYNSTTGEIIAIEYLNSDCYGCAATGTCPTNGGGGNPNNSDLAAAALAEYNMLQGGDYGLVTTMTLRLPSNSSASVTRPIDWTLAKTSYFVITCKSTTTANKIPNTLRIHVDNLLNNNTVFDRISASVFWNISWMPGNLYPGYIDNNDTFTPRGNSNVSGNVHYSAKSSLWEIFNAQPDVAVDSYLTVNYDLLIVAEE